MYHNKKAFTLIEMLIVIVIIGILAATLVPRILGSMARARDTSRTSHIRQIGQAVQLYTFDYGTIPNSPGTGYKNIENVSGSISEYLKSIPTDKGNGLVVNSDGDCKSEGDYYAYFSKDNTAAITAIMETGKGNTGVCDGVASSNLVFTKHTDGYNLEYGDYTRIGSNIVTNSENFSKHDGAIYSVGSGHGDPFGGNLASLIEKTSAMKATTAKSAIVSNFTVSEEKSLTFSYFTKRGIGWFGRDFGIYNYDSPGQKNIGFCRISDENTVSLYSGEGYCRIEQYSDDRYRVSYTAIGGINMGDRINIYYGDPGGEMETGSRYVFGVQLNEGPLALPYDKTEDTTHIGEMK